MKQVQYNQDASLLQLSALGLHADRGDDLVDARSPVMLQRHIGRRGSTIRSLFALFAGLPLALVASGGTVRPLDAQLHGYAYPYPVKTHVLTSQGQELTMAYMDESPAASPRGTVLLLHGKNFCGAYWGPVMKALLADGFRVVAPDQIGFGKSSKPTAYQYSIHQMAAQTRDLLAALGVEKALVVGHSMGGMVATRFCLMFPAAAVRLALMNPIGLEDWKRMTPYATVDQLEAEELAKKPEAVRKYMTASYFDNQWKDEYAPLIELQAGWVAGPDWPMLARVSALTSDMIFTQPVVYEFSDLKLPTLLIIGDRDRTALGKNRAAPEAAAQMGQYQVLGPNVAAMIPGARLVVMKGLGHIPQYENFADTYAALAGFLCGN